MSALEPRKRGKPPKHSRADKHEMRRYREAGVSIKRLAAMYEVTETTVHAYLREIRALLGPERLPDDKKHLARQHLFISTKTTSSESHT